MFDDVESNVFLFHLEKGSDWPEDEDLFRSRSSDVEQINEKLKFEIIEQRIERLTTEYPSLFDQTSDETIDRLDRLIKLFVDGKTSISKRNRHDIDEETQTDDETLTKQTQINQKLKRALQTIKEKVQRFVRDRPEHFPQSTDETIERLEQIFIFIDHLNENLREKTDQLENVRMINEKK